MLSQLRALLFCDFLLVSTWLHIVQLHVQARPQKAESYRLPGHEHDSKSAEEKVGKDSNASGGHSSAGTIAIHPA